MERSTTRRARGLLATLAVGSLAVAACGKDPVKPPAAKPFVYRAPRDPVSVLQNLINAYNNRDSVETAAVYDVNYKGYSPDAPPGAGYFTRSDEVHHVHRLYKDPNIVNVSLSFGPVESWQLVPAEVDDPPGTVVLAIRTSTIAINIVSVSLFEVKNIPMEYAFAPNVTTPGDTTWTILRWRETPN